MNRLFLGFLWGILSFTTACISPHQPLKYELDGWIVVSHHKRLELPQNFPVEMQTSGKHAIRSDFKPVSKLGIKLMAPWPPTPNYPRTTGIRLPVQGQPLQGFSGITHSNTSDRFFVVSDNGYGIAQNSRDVPLYFLEVSFDWPKKQMTIHQVVFLKDPHHTLKSPIVYQKSKERYLTGSDLDPESIQVVENRIFIGDEFGPYLIEVALDGTLRKAYELPKLAPGMGFAPSGGIEGLTLSPDKKELLLSLEKPVYQDAKSKTIESESKPFVRIYRFDLSTNTFKKDHLRYPLAKKKTRVSEVAVSLDGQSLYFLERDDFEGLPQYQCQPQQKEPCIENVAQFKRVYRTKWPTTSENELEKVGYIDLLRVPVKKKSLREQVNGNLFIFPFVTPESLLPLPGNHLLVGNDNNFAFSAGREIMEQDHSEWILLKLH